MTAQRGSVFGLLVESSAPIPGLGAPHRTGAPDLRVELGWMPEQLRPPPGAPEAYRLPREEWRAEIRVRRAPGGLHFHFQDGCQAALAADGATVWCTWPDGLGTADAAIYLLGPVLAPLLRERGLTVLHAAGLALAGRALLLAGTAGLGKSTTAAALAQRGMRVVSDDVQALDAAPDGTVLAHPGPPRIRLWGDASQALYGSAEEAPLITPNWSKRYRDVADQAIPGPVPVAAVYLLAPREPVAPRLEPIPPAEALMLLVGNSYHGWISHPPQRARELERLAAMLRQARVRRLVPGDGVATLPALADLILDDFTRNV